MILVEKDSWMSGEDSSANSWFLDLEQNVRKLQLPKMILLATSITGAEFDHAKQVGFADTVMMKPLRASMVAACLQQVLGTGKKMQQGKDMVNGSNLLRSLLRGKKILVVDDNMVNRRVAAGALKKFGAGVECADSGKAALALLQLPHDFDACFMDIQMPEMDGYVLDLIFCEINWIFNSYFFLFNDHYSFRQQFFIFSWKDFSFFFLVVLIYSLYCLLVY